MDFKAWLDGHLSGDIPAEVVAFNFNLYERMEDGVYDVQLVGCTAYDPDDADWACDTVFSTEEELYTFRSGEWEEAMEDFLATVKEYLANASADNRLLMAQYLTAGFVDGDLEVIREGN